MKGTTAIAKLVSNRLTANLNKGLGATGVYYIELTPNRPLYRSKFVFIAN